MAEADRVTSISIRIELATERDVAVILHLIASLAEYERLADQVVATEAGLRESLFGGRRGAEVAIAYAGEEPIGFAVWFHNFSTFLGRAGLYLEDVFVVSEWRGRGVGRQLLAYVAQVAVTRGCARMEWSVLDWNELAIGFYRKLGAEPMSEWTVYRLSGEALNRLAT
jgi:GNAT superfamily N-acetyltransferase